jgi:hypothetical protein
MGGIASVARESTVAQLRLEGRKRFRSQNVQDPVE